MSGARPDGEGKSPNRAGWATTLVGIGVTLIIAAASWTFAAGGNAREMTGIGKRMDDSDTIQQSQTAALAALTAHVATLDATLAGVQRDNSQLSLQLHETASLMQDIRVMVGRMQAVVDLMVSRVGPLPSQGDRLNPGRR